MRMSDWSSDVCSSDLAKKVSPAVVNIASTQEVRAPRGQQGMPFGFPEGSPFEEFFERFGEQFGGRDQSPSAPQRATALGSGFIIDATGYVVTNNHVIDGASEVSVRLGDETVSPDRKSCV